MTELAWLQPTQQRLISQFETERLPHALLIDGVEGIGKMHLVRSLIATVLSLPADDEIAHWAVNVPDFSWVCPEEGKKSISVDQIRELGNSLTLSSHTNAGKVALISPAELMTQAAANALLKTLEEPVAQRWLILASSDVSRLPATIRSRCERVSIALPNAQSTVDWLQSQGTDAALAMDALRWSEGAPLRALSLIESGQLERLRELRAGLSALLGGQISALALAAKLSDLDFSEVVSAVRNVCIEIIRTQSGAEMGDSSEFSDYVIDLRGLFCYLDTLNRAMTLSAGSFNEELTLETLLLPWKRRFLNAA